MADLPADGTQLSPQQVHPQPAIRRRRGLPRWLLLTGAIAVVSIFALGMLGFLGWNLGPLAFGVGLAAAVLPVPLLIAAFLWLDRYEPEPTHYLVLCFLWGAFVATGLALAVNTGAAYLVERAGLPDALVGVLVAPFIEELGKAGLPLLILWLRRHEVSGITDGIVYCGLSAIGFAMVENILYLGGYGFSQGYEQYGPASGTQMVFLLFILRIVMTGFAHPLFSSMTGVGIGLAARSAQQWVRVLAPLPGLLLAMMLHGAWNLMATLGGTVSPYLLLYGYFGVMLPLFLGMVGLALWVRAHEGRLAARILTAYASAGWFTPPEVAALGTLGRRHAARVWAKRVAGPAGHRAMRDFQFAATRLALVRDDLNRQVHSNPAHLAHSIAEEAELLATMRNARQAYAGRDPQMPPARWDGRSYRITFPDGVERTIAAPPEPVVPLPVVMMPPMPAPPAYPYYSG